MKDRILAAHLADFQQQFGMERVPEADAFEAFVNYSIVAQHYPDAFDPSDLATGGGGDLGLDGIATLVNEHLVATESDIDHFKSVLRRLDAHFIFVQAKTSSHFDASDIGSFISGVRTFFA